MGCKECGKPKCNGKCGCKSPKVLQINNPAEYITFHKVSIPAAMGDSTTNPPAVGKYKNVLLYYEADQTSWLYSTDGIPTKLANGVTNYEDAVNLPQINGHTLIGNKTSHELGLQSELIAGDNIQIEDNTISATGTTYTAGRGLTLNDTEFSAETATESSVGIVKPGVGLGVQEDGTLDVNVGDGLEINGDNEVEVIEPAPVGLFSSPKILSGTGSTFTLDGTTISALDSLSLYGDVNQNSYTAKNLFGVTGSYKNGVFETINEDGSINLVGQATANVYFSFPVMPISLFSNSSTYTFWYDGGTLPLGVEFRAGLYNGSTWVRHMLGNSSPLTSTQKTFTGTSNISGADRMMAQVYIPNGTTIDLRGITVQLEKSSSKTDFVPFVGGYNSPSPTFPQPVKVSTGDQTITVSGDGSSQTYKLNLGKNLFDKSNFTNAANDYIGGSGLYRVGSGTSNNDNVAIIEIEPNTTYTVSKPAQASSNRLRVGISAALMSNNGPFPVWGGGDDAVSVTVRSNADSKYMYIYYCGSLVNKQEALNSLQVEKAQTPTDYAEYFAPIELLPVNGSQNYIWKDGDDWKFHEEIKRLDIDGTESWQFQTVSGYSAGRMRLELTDNYVGTGRQEVKSNRFVFDDSGEHKDGIGFISGNYLYLYQGSVASDAATFKTWVAAHPTTVYYALASATDTTITNADIIKQLDALSTAHTYNEQTTFAALGNIPVLLHATAYSKNYTGTIEGIQTNVATRENIGLVKIGDGLDITTDGLLSVTSEPESNIPEYFKSQLETAIPAIKNNMLSVGHSGETFIFITDIHWSRNAKHSPALIKKIINETNVRLVVNGGDNITNNSTKSAAIEELDNVIRTFDSATENNFFSMFGNHDSNYIGNESYPERRLDPSEVYEAIFRRQEPLVASWNTETVDNANPDAQYYYYVDNAATKTRYVMLSTAENTMGATQLSWLSTLLTNSSGWNVLIFAHWINNGSSATPTSSYTSDGTSLKTLCDSHTDKVKAIFAGHIHFDWEDHTSGGIPIVFTTTDGLSASQFNTDPIIRDTISEQAFDVITVDYSTGTIKCVRIGRGSDRTISSNV